MDMDALRDELLLATLPNILFDSWSQQALRDGAEQSGHDQFTIERAFPGGIPELVEHFADWTDRRMLAELDGQELAQMKVGQRIALAIRTYLTVLEPHKEAKRRQLAYLAMPQHLPMGVRLLYRTVDAMWFAAGDTATDYNHYTKRATLAAVLSAATFYWLDDQSDNHTETWAFVDRRLKDVATFGKATASVNGLGKLLSNLPSPSRFMRQARQRAGVGKPNATSHLRRTEV